MDRTYIDNHHVVARYLADRLSEDDRRAFESYMHAHPEIVQDLEAAVKLKVGLRTLSERGELDAIGSASWYRSPKTLAIAASIAVVIGSLLWLGKTTFSAPTLVATVAELGNTNGNPLSIASSHTILRVRGAAYDAEIALPASRQAIALRILPEVEVQPPLYRVTLMRVADDDSLSAVASIEKLTPADDGYVTLYMDSSGFVKGRYQLVLSSDASTNAAEAVSRFKIRLTDTSTQPQ